jgi:hypothetical protein
MTYSRWINSAWYTYWLADEATKDLGKEDQILCTQELGRDLRFTYRELKEDIGKCLDKVREDLSKDIEGKIYDGVEEATGAIMYKACTFKGKAVTDEEIRELKEYMLKFLEDVSSHYSREDNEE